MTFSQIVYEIDTICDEAMMVHKMRCLSLLQPRCAHHTTNLQINSLP